jgi:hypothetical protein
MNARDPHGPSNIANQIESLKGEILARYRDEVRRDAEQAAQIHQLDDEERQDRMPALTIRLSNCCAASRLKTLNRTPPSALRISRFDTNRAGSH